MLMAAHKDTDGLKCTLFFEFNGPLTYVSNYQSATEILNSLPLPHPSLKGTERGVARSSS